MGDIEPQVQAKRLGRRLRVDELDSPVADQLGRVAQAAIFLLLEIWRAVNFFVDVERPTDSGFNPRWP